MSFVEDILQQYNHCHNHDREYFHTPSPSTKVPIGLFVTSPLPSPGSQEALLSVTVLLWVEVPVHGFYSITILRSIPISCLYSCFLLIAEQYSIVQLDNSLSIHQLVDIWVVSSSEYSTCLCVDLCFHILWVNNQE